MRNPWVSSWHEAERQQAREVIEEYGQPITFWPRKRDERSRRSIPDTSRASFDFCGAFDWDYANAQLSERDMDISTRGPWIFAYRADLKTMPGSVDQFTLIEKNTGLRLTFEINDVRRDGQSGVVFMLNQIGSQV